MDFCHALCSGVMTAITEPLASSIAVTEPFRANAFPLVSVLFSELPLLSEFGPESGSEAMIARTPRSASMGVRRYSDSWTCIFVASDSLGFVVSFISYGMTDMEPVGSGIEVLSFEYGSPTCDTSCRNSWIRCVSLSLFVRASFSSGVKGRGLVVTDSKSRENDRLYSRFQFPADLPRGILWVLCIIPPFIEALSAALSPIGITVLRPVSLGIGGKACCGAFCAYSGLRVWPMIEVSLAYTLGG